MVTQSGRRPPAGVVVVAEVEGVLSSSSPETVLVPLYVISELLFFPRTSRP